MTGVDAETLAVYDQGAAAYAEKFASDKPYLRLENFLDQVPEGGRVLDLGCGIGNAAARMRARGFDCVALDASEGMAAEAARRHGLDVMIADFDAIPSLGQFNGIWAHFSLLHAEASTLPRHLSAIHSALLPGGLFLISMKTGTGTRRDSLGRRYAYVTEDRLCDLLETAGFRIGGLDTGADEGFDGTIARFVFVTAYA